MLYVTNLVLKNCQCKSKGLQIIKPLLTLIDKGLDVPGILQNLIREAQAGNSLDSKKWGQNGDRKE
jgi:hypothetical protein